MAVVGIFAFNFTTTLPLLATHTFHGGAGTYSGFMAAMGAGAVIGGLMVAHRSRPSTAMLSRHRPGLRRHAPGGRRRPDRDRGDRGPGLHGALQYLVHLDCQCDHSAAGRPAMRGRVMALYAIAFLGSTPIGAPLSGLDRRHQQSTDRRDGRGTGHLGCLRPSRLSSCTAGACPKRHRQSTPRCPTSSPKAPWGPGAISQSVQSRVPQGRRPPGLRREERPGVDARLSGVTGQKGPMSDRALGSYGREE